MAISSVATAADLPSTTGSVLTCGEVSGSGRSTACDTAATLTPVGWTRKIPVLVNIDVNDNGNVVFTDGTSLAPWVSVATNPAAYFNILSVFSITVANNQTFIIHSSDGLTVDGMAFASRGY